MLSVMEASRLLCLRGSQQHRPGAFSEKLPDVGLKPGNTPWGGKWPYYSRWGEGEADSWSLGHKEGFGGGKCATAPWLCENFLLERSPLPVPGFGGTPRVPAFSSLCKHLRLWQHIFCIAFYVKQWEIKHLMWSHGKLQGGGGEGRDCGSEWLAPCQTECFMLCT